MCPNYGRSATPPFAGRGTILGHHCPGSAEFWAVHHSRYPKVRPLRAYCLERQSPATGRGGTGTTYRGSRLGANRRLCSSAPTAQAAAVSFAEGAWTRPRSLCCPCRGERGKRRWLSARYRLSLPMSRDFLPGLLSLERADKGSGGFGYLHRRGVPLCFPLTFCDHRQLKMTTRN